MSNTPSNTPPEPGGRPSDDAGFGEDGPAVVDKDAGKSEEEKLEDAVEDLKNDPD